MQEDRREPMQTIRVAVALFVIIVATSAKAQVQIGTGPNGGVCSGPNCGPDSSPNVVVGAALGECVGPNCGSPDSPSHPLAHGPLPKPSQQLARPRPFGRPVPLTIATTKQIGGRSIGLRDFPRRALGAGEVRPPKSAMSQP
jgi:hypothetical protein